jgi:hypothetical protein
MIANHIRQAVDDRGADRRWLTRRHRDACSLQLLYLAALAVDLDPHTIDLGSNEFSVWHVFRSAKWIYRDKNKQRTTLQAKV